MAESDLGRRATGITSQTQTTDQPVREGTVKNYKYQSSFWFAISSSASHIEETNPGLVLFSLLFVLLESHVECISSLVFKFYKSLPCSVKFIVFRYRFINAFKKKFSCY